MPASGYPIPEPSESKDEQQPDNTTSITVQETQKIEASKPDYEPGQRQHQTPEMEAIASPKILMLSGIGDANELAKFDISVVANVTQVGRNLYDDIFVSAGFLIPQNKDVPFYDYGLAPAVIFGSTKNSSSVVDIESSVGVGTLKGFPGPEHSFWLWPNVMHLKSRGTVTLRSSNPDDAPFIDPGYLTAPGDIQMCKTALELGIDIGNQLGLGVGQK